MNAKMRRARPPSAPPIIGPKGSPALAEATGDVVPEGTVVSVAVPEIVDDGVAVMTGLTSI